MDIKEMTREAIAIGMIVMAIVVLVSLLTYSPEDYRFDNETGEGPASYRNKVGWLGMVLSRFLYRSVGLAGYVLVFFVFMWGGLLALSKKPVQYFWYRVIASIFLVFA